MVAAVTPDEQRSDRSAAVRVRMKHWMYLADDGDTMINRVIISKLGIVVAETTEYFRRGVGNASAKTNAD